VHSPIARLLIASCAGKLLVLLIVYSLNPDRIVAGDTASYENPARALMSTGRFVSNLDEPDRVETLRTPGYPAFLAAVFFVSSGSHLAVAVTQIGISTATLWLLYVLAARLWNAQIAMVCAVLFAVDLLSFVYASLLHTETLYTFAIVVLVLAGVTLLQGLSVRWALAFATAAACATLARPIAYFLFLPSLGAILLQGTLAGQGMRRVAAVALVAVLPWIVLVEGWRLRNYVLTGRAEIAQIAAVNLLWYRGAGIIAVRDQISFDEARDRIARSLPDTTGWSPGAVSAYYEREGLRLIVSHPGLFLRNQLYGALKVLAGPGRADLLHYFAGVPYEDAPDGAVDVSVPLLRQRLVSGPLWGLIPLAFATTYLVLLYACALLGVWEVVREEKARWVSHAFVGWVLLYHVLVAAGPEAYARFRVPIMPLLALYAGRGAIVAVARLAEKPFFMRPSKSRV